MYDGRNERAGGEKELPWKWLTLVVTTPGVYRAAITHETAEKKVAQLKIEYETRRCARAHDDDYALLCLCRSQVQAWHTCSLTRRWLIRDQESSQLRRLVEIRYVRRFFIDVLVILGLCRIIAWNTRLANHFFPTWESGDFSCFVLFSSADSVVMDYFVVANKMFIRRIFLDKWLDAF